MAALAGLKEAKPDGIFKAVLKGGLQKEDNPVFQEFVNYEVDEAFWRMTAQGVGYQEEDPDLFQLATHLLLTASTRTMRPEFLAGFQTYISSARQAYCYDFVTDWIHSEDSKEFYEIAEQVEDKLKLPQRFMKLQVADLTDTELFPCINEILLVKLATDISNRVVDVDVITQTAEKRQTCVWYDDVKNFYECVLQVAKMQTFYKEHSAGFHTVEPEKVWKEYTTEYYAMDAYYREFHKSYSESLKIYHETLSDLFARVTEYVEGLYETWFLDQLGNNWSNACADNLREYGRVLDVPQQTDFYRRYVASSGGKTYVVISDALRYEVAASLAERLRRETQAEVNLESIQGVFPTTTKFGMAALLPHKALSVVLKSGKTDRLAVLADGQSTEVPNRNKLLKNKEPDSVALKYKDIIGMKRADRQALIKGMKVVYIYHDVIDENGHSGGPVFVACDAAVDELKNMTRIITNEWGGTNIVITSDHGFIYTHKPFAEYDKVETSDSDQEIEVDRRYAIMTKGAQSKYLLPVKFLGGTTPYDAFAPRENKRLKILGGGLNYAHGGISLQEMVVPVIKYHFLRNQSKEYKENRNKYDVKPVEVDLLSANRKICNMIFTLNFYQKDAVGDNREAATYRLFFTDGAGKQISDIATIIADKTSNNAQERTFRLSFNLKSLKYENTDPYYLIFEDEDGLQVNREEFQIDIALALDEFDFS